MRLRRQLILTCAFFALASPSWAQEKRNICILYCPQVDACKLTVEGDGTCTCKCSTFPDYTIDVFKSLVDTPTVTQLMKDGVRDVVTLRPVEAKDKLKGLGIPDIQARETSPHPRAEAGQTPRDFHEQEGRRAAMNAAEAHLNQLRSDQQKK